jgi:hypothetical protein
VDERARRVGKNEALFRAVNEQVNALAARASVPGADTLSILCECGDPDCVTQIEVERATYEHVRGHPARFFVARGHEDVASEYITTGADDYSIVEKRPGGPFELAHETRPRRG